MPIQPTARETRRAFDYDNDSFRISTYGSKGELAFVGDRIQCHFCGQLFKNLGTHIRRHGLSHTEYRALFEIKTSAPLCGDIYREQLRALYRSGRALPPHVRTNPTLKLTIEQVLEIRRLFASGAKKSHIAKAFDVSHRTVSQIVSGERWKAAASGVKHLPVS